MKHAGKLEGRECAARGVRVEAEFEVRVHSDRGAVEARVLNLSSDGFRLRTQLPLEVGSIVTLAARGEHPVKALICWAVGLEAGGVFAEPAAL